MQAKEVLSFRPVHHKVIVVGGGQAGLSVSYYLKQHGIDHLVLEQSTACHAWRDQRWDAFCLVTPNWQCQLPGTPYAGASPDGFMTKPQIVDYLAEFVRQVAPPLREGVRVERIRRDARGRFQVATSAGDYSADHVVVAIGNYHVPRVLEGAESLPAHILQVDALQYRNAAALPQGAVLVVGSGQSGCQIAEDLHLAGRRVHLCVGSAPRVSRRYRGRDVVAWLHDMGHYELSVDKHPMKEGVRAKANHYVTGRDGGRDIDLRVFAAQDMKLHGRLLSLVGNTLSFGDDLKHNLDAADATNESIKRGIDNFIAQQAINAPTEPAYVPCWQPPEGTSTLDLVDEEISTIIWSVGYKPDFSFIELPAFNERGLPVHQRGVTPVPGLYFVGLPWLHTWGSGRFSGVARDAEYIVQQVAGGASTLMEAAR